MTPGRASTRDWLALAVIALPCVLYSMDLTVLFLAVPSLSAQLEPSSTQLLWISDIYGFMVAGSLITMGTLGDRIGRRRLLLMGAALFGVASVLAAFSRTPTMLIASRALLGVAGATVAPSTLSLIRNIFVDPEERTFAIGIWTTSYSVGALLAPPLGGVLLDHFWWGSVFLLAVPTMVLLLVLGPILLPEFRDPHAGRLDVYSAALSLIAVLAVIYGVKRIAAEGLDARAAAVVVIGVAIGALFVRRQKTLGDPLIDLRLFRDPAFSVSLATYLIAIFMLFGVSMLIAQYLQLVLGLSPFRAGLWMLPSSLGFIVGSISVPVLTRRVRAARVIGGCFLLSAVGFVLLMQVDAGSGADLALIVVGSVLMSIAVSPVVTLATDLVVSAAPPEKAGAAAAISETSAEFGGALSIAILGSVATAVYRARMGGASLVGVPADIADTARSTLGGAVAMAARLPATQGAALLVAARQAFVGGLRTTAAISAVLAVGTALLAVRARARTTATAVPGT